MRPVWAVVCVLLTVAGLIASVLEQQQIHPLNRIRLPCPPEALVGKARDLLARSGYTQSPLDMARDFRKNIPEARDYLRFAQDNPRRWKRVYSGSLPIRFWYRESPVHFPGVET